MPLVFIRFAWLKERCVARGDLLTLRAGLVGTVLITAACSSIADPSLRDREPTIEGTIVDRNIHTSFMQEEPNIHVKESLDDECGIVFVVDNSTEIKARADTGKLTKVSADALVVGARVAVWAYRGPLLDSCPRQARAEGVEVRG